MESMDRARDNSSHVASQSTQKPDIHFQLFLEGKLSQWTKDSGRRKKDRSIFQTENRNSVLRELFQRGVSVIGRFKEK